MFNRVISYHLVQLLVSALLVALIPALREPSKVLFISYWLVTAITLAGYWVAHCKNPGVYTQQMQSMKPDLTDTNNTNAATSEAGTFEVLKNTKTKNAEDSRDNGLESKKELSVEHKPVELSTIRTYQENTQINLTFCRLCGVDQPLRTKHCHQCEVCILTFDHHCPWLQNCVGQKNRPHFYIYTILQTCQLGFAITLLMLQAILQQQYLTLPLIFLLAGILLLMLSLLVSHTYLMVTGHTTWQYLSWAKISYLQDKEKETMSPFSEGVCQNIKLYWRLGFGNSHHMWKLKK